MRQKRSERFYLISQENWQGKADYGENIYENGHMYWEGTIHAVIHISDGKSILTIQAKGSQANGIYPYMILELDGKEIGETFDIDVGLNF